MKQVEAQMRSKEGLWLAIVSIYKNSQIDTTVTNETRNNNKNTKIAEP